MPLHLQVGLLKKFWYFFRPIQPKKLNTFASYIKLYDDAVTNNAYLDY